MICPKCGKKIASYDFSCIFCGWVSNEIKSQEKNQKQENNQKTPDNNKNNTPPENTLKFCSWCGEKLEGNFKFCGSCGKAVTASYSNNAIVTVPRTSLFNFDLSENFKKHWIISLCCNFICIILFFLTEVVVGVGSFEKSFSVTKILSGNQYLGDIGMSDFEWIVPFYSFVIVLLIITCFIMLQPLILNNPFKTGYLGFVQLMSIIFFGMNIIIYSVVANEIENQSNGYGSFGLNIIGWIYVIISLATIIHLFYLSSNLKKYHPNGLYDPNGLNDR